MARGTTLVVINVLTTYYHLTLITMPTPSYFHKIAPDL